MMLASADFESLRSVRRGVADVATSRKGVELHASTVERQAVKLASKREDAVKAGREDLPAKGKTARQGFRGNSPSYAVSLPPSPPRRTS